MGQGKVRLTFSTLVLCGSSAQFKAQLQNPALSCYLKGLNIVGVSVSGYYWATCAVFKLLSALLELLLCLKVCITPKKPLCAAHVILLKHLNDHCLAAVIAIHNQSFQLSVLEGRTSGLRAL